MDSRIRLGLAMWKKLCFRDFVSSRCVLLLMLFSLDVEIHFRALLLYRTTEQTFWTFHIVEESYIYVAFSVEKGFDRLGAFKGDFLTKRVSGGPSKIYYHCSLIRPNQTQNK